MIIHCSYTELIDLAKIIPNPKNPNEHSENQVDLLASIMKVQGVRSPIKVSKRSGFITAGHCRLMAAKKNGWDKFPVDMQEYESEAMEYADLVADNAIQELSTQNMAKIGEDILELGPDFDITLLGFPNFKIEPMELMPELKSGDDGSEHCQVSFILTLDQRDQVNDALTNSKGLGDFGDTGNPNSNGNAIARICELFQNKG